MVDQINQLLYKQNLTFSSWQCLYLVQAQSPLHYVTEYEFEILISQNYLRLKDKKEPIEVQNLELTDTGSALLESIHNLMSGKKPTLKSMKAVSTSIEWINEWVNLFPEQSGSNRLRDYKSAENKMNQFLILHPDITKDIIFAATKKYLATANPDFTYKASNFISRKGSDGFHSPLLDLCIGIKNQPRPKGGTDIFLIY